MSLRFSVSLGLAACASLHPDTADAECGLERAVMCLKSVRRRKMYHTSADSLQEYDDAFEAQVLQLEILSKENISDYDEYAESKKTNHIPHVCHHSSSLSVLRRAIAALELNDADLKTYVTFHTQAYSSSKQKQYSILHP
jgi:hypothetical protein